MERRAFGETGLEVAPIGLGGSSVPEASHASFFKRSKEIST